LCGPLGPFLSFAFESAALPAFAGWQNNAPRNLAFLDLVDNVGIISQITPTFVTNGLSVLQSVSVVCLFDRFFACEFQGYSESLKECFLNVVSCIGRRDQGKSFREQLPGVPTAHEINLVTTVEQKFAVTLFDSNKFDYYDTQQFNHFYNILLMLRIVKDANPMILWNYCQHPEFFTN